MEKIDIKNYGIVYIIHNYEFNIVKIGVTTNMPNRLKALVSASGCDLKVVYTTPPIKEYFDVEAKAHLFFKNKRRVNTEWFNISVKEACNFLKEFQCEKEVHLLYSSYVNGKTISDLSKRYDVSRAYITKILSYWNLYKIDKKSILIEKPNKEISLLKRPVKEKNPSKNKDVQNEFVPSKYRKNIGFVRVDTNLYKHKEDDVYKTKTFNNGIIKERFFLKKEDAILYLKS
jgi:hypothetical protein